MEKSNQIIGDLELKDSKINWGKGSNNCVYCDNTFGPVVLEKSKIAFTGSNALIYIVGGNKKSLKILATLSPESCIYIGRNSSFHKTATAHLVASERSIIVIGQDCMFSKDVWVRTSDAHPIFSVETKKRLNYPKGIVIGDHIWIGQEVTILKGAQVGSGSIIGTKAMLTNKKYPSNTSYGGIPAKALCEPGSIYFDKTDLNAATKEQSQKFDSLDSTKHIYKYSADECIADRVLEFLETHKRKDERIDYLKNIPQNKNRFAL